MKVINVRCRRLNLLTGKIQNHRVKAYVRNSADVRRLRRDLALMLVGTVEVGHG